MFPDAAKDFQDALERQRGEDSSLLQLRWYYTKKRAL